MKKSRKILFIVWLIINLFLIFIGVIGYEFNPEYTEGAGLTLFFINILALGVLVYVVDAFDVPFIMVSFDDYLLSFVSVSIWIMVIGYVQWFVITPWVFTKIHVAFNKYFNKKSN